MPSKYKFLRFYKGEKIDESIQSFYNDMDFYQTINQWNLQSLNFSHGDYVYVAIGRVS